MRDLIRNYAIASTSHRAINQVFGIDWCNIFNSIYYYDTTDHANYLFIIHRNGIIKYDLDVKIIKERYGQFINNEYMIENVCCLDLEDDVIYMNLFAEKRLITFNIKSKIWNLDFMDYGMKKPRPMGCSSMIFVSNGEDSGVQMELEYFDRTSTVFTMNKFGQMKILKKTNGNMETYNIMNQSLKQLQTRFRNSPTIDLDKILLILFKKRVGIKLVHCHLAFEQIIFFIFETRHYSIDCVDILKPNEIYFDIKTIQRDDFDTIFFDRSSVLHRVCITDCKNDEVHCKMLPRSIIPKSIIQNNNKRIQNFCDYCSRRNNLLIPTAIIGEIIRFSQIFV